MTSQTLFLPAGWTLTITADRASSGYYHRLPASAGEEPFSPVVVSVSSTTVVGPFVGDRNYSIDSASGILTYAVTLEELTYSGDVDDFSGIASSFSTVPSGRSVTVDSGEQFAAFGTFTVTGTITIGGEMRVGAWPF